MINNAVRRVEVLLVEDNLGHARLTLGGSRG